jgi:hypothetical protein
MIAVLPTDESPSKTILHFDFILAADYIIVIFLGS